MNEPSPPPPTDHRLALTDAARGVVGAFAGVVLLSTPRMSVTAIALVFAAYLLADGVLSLYAGRHARRTGHSTRQLMLGGTIDIAAVIAVAAVAAIGPAVLPLRIVAGVRAIASGACDALWAERERANALLVMAGVAAIFTGLVILAWPGPATLALPWLVGFEAMLSGALLFAGGTSAYKQAFAVPGPHTP